MPAIRHMTIRTRKYVKKQVFFEATKSNQNA